MINGLSSSEMHHNMQNGMIDDMIRNTPDCQHQLLDPYELPPSLFSTIDNPVTRRVRNKNTVALSISSGDPMKRCLYLMEARRRAQIERSNEWIEKMSPVVKYKIQEYIRKQKAKKMQRRKFSLACGLNNRMKQEQMYHHSTPSASSTRRRSKKNTEASSSKNRNHNMHHMHSAPMLERNYSQPEMHDSRRSASLASRRKSAPADKMDMRDLDDLG